LHIYSFSCTVQIDAHIFSNVHLPPQHNFVVGIEMVFILPFCLTENLHALRHSSQLAMVCLAYLFFAVIIRSIQEMKGEAPEVHLMMQNATSEGVALMNIDGTFLQAFSIQALAFCCQFNVLPVLAELEDPTPERMNIVKYSSILISFLLYAIFGIFGYLAFGAKTEADLLSNFSPTDSVITVGRVVLAIALLLKCPLMMQPLRATIHAIMHPPKKQTPANSPAPAELSVQGGDGSDQGSGQGMGGGATGGSGQGQKKFLLLCVETVVLLGLACIPAMCITDIAALYSLVGATCGSMVCFILPGGIAWFVDTGINLELTPNRSRSRSVEGTANKSHKLVAGLVLGFGMVVMVASVAAAIKSF
jgi:amino acid permease